MEGVFAQRPRPPKVLRVDGGLSLPATASNAPIVRLTTRACSSLGRKLETRGLRAPGRARGPGESYSCRGMGIRSRRHRVAHPYPAALDHTRQDSPLASNRFLEAGPDLVHMRAGRAFARDLKGHRPDGKLRALGQIAHPQPPDDDVLAGLARPQVEPIEDLCLHQEDLTALSPESGITLKPLAGNRLCLRHGLHRHPTRGLDEQMLNTGHSWVSPSQVVSSQPRGLPCSPWQPRDRSPFGVPEEAGRCHHEEGRVEV